MKMVVVAIEDDGDGSSDDGEPEMGYVCDSPGRFVLKQQQQPDAPRLDDMPECVLASIYERVPDLLVPHRRVCSRFYKQLSLQGRLRLHLRCGAACCAPGGAAHTVTALPAFVERLHPDCHVQVQVTTCGGQCSSYKHWVVQALDAILDACAERGLTKITDLALHVERPERAETLPCETLAAILVCNPRLTCLSLRGFALDTSTLPLLSDAIYHRGVELQSLALGVMGYCPPTEMLASVRHLLSTSLVALELSKSMVYDSAATGLALSLLQTPCTNLRRLNLSATGIGIFSTGNCFSKVLCSDLV